MRISFFIFFHSVHVNNWLIILAPARITTTLSLLIYMYLFFIHLFVVYSKGSCYFKPLANVLRFLLQFLNISISFILSYILAINYLMPFFICGQLLNVSTFFFLWNQSNIFFFFVSELILFI